MKSNNDEVNETSGPSKWATMLTFWERFKQIKQATFPYFYLDPASIKEMIAQVVLERARSVAIPPTMLAEVEQLSSQIGERAADHFFRHLDVVIQQALTYLAAESLTMGEKEVILSDSDGVTKTKLQGMLADLNGMRLQHIAGDLRGKGRPDDDESLFWQRLRAAIEEVKNDPVKAMQSLTVERVAARYYGGKKKEQGISGRHLTGLCKKHTGGKKDADHFKAALGIIEAGLK